MNTKTRINPALLTLSITLFGVSLTMAAHAGAKPDVAAPRPQGPCNIYTAAGDPCVAAHSTTRALSASYNGPLYQVLRRSDGKTLDIGVVQSRGSDAGGYANAAAQDAFCVNTVCVLSVIYDQTGKGNHLYQAPPGTFKGPEKGGFDTQPIADMAPITIGGHKVYGVYIIPGMGFRNNNATGLAIDDEPEGVYSVMDGTHYDSGCCFDYGNASTNGRAVGAGTMETTYFGTSTVWGTGGGPGPWIMADMESGMFSGYSLRKNDADPTIDSWRFITAVVDGGGGNHWDLRGGNAQQGSLTTFYSGVRPNSRASSAYYPMHKQGAILLGTGGDNGNGSSGTFYEGVMTTGYPAEATTDAVQANIVAARYDVQTLSLSRATTYTGRSTQDLTETFTNTTAVPALGLRLSISGPNQQWISVVAGSPRSSATFADPIAPGASVSATFRITAPAATGAGVLTGNAEWAEAVTGRRQFETAAERVRNVLPIKINEVRFSTGANSTDQFIELFNASASSVDLSRWTIVHTPSQWAPVNLARIPAGTRLAPGGFYLLGASSSGLAAEASAGAITINVRSTVGLAAGQQIDVDGEHRTIVSVGTPAAAMTTLFVPVSTGPWITIPAGSTSLPVTNAAGFEAGEKIGIDIGGNYEVATVTVVGKAATQTTLAAAAAAGSANIKVAADANMMAGDTLMVGSGGRKESVTVKSIGTAGAGGTGVDLTAPLRFDHMKGIDLSDAGTGIGFSPATRFPHVSGDAVQALGGGITLDRSLARSHAYGAAVVSPLDTTAGYQGPPAPNQWFGATLSARAGSIALLDASGSLVVDAMVYGSQQSNSSGNGTIVSPEIATVEGDQGKGGCIVVAPAPSGGPGPAAPNAAANRSVGRFPDGTDTDSNCNDFLTQATTSLSAASDAGATNIKVASVADFEAGQTILIDTGANPETAVVAEVGTAGATTVSTAIGAGETVIPVADVTGFNVGQTISIDREGSHETAVVVSTNRRGNATIGVAAQLTFAHAAGAQISGSGITLAAGLNRAHASGTQVSASGPPTPGAPNQYFRRHK
jgi:hypothetical protein